MKNKLFLSLLLLLLVQMVGFSQEMNWTPEFSMNFKSINSTTISPDGKYVAYVVRTPVMEGEKSEYVQQIWVAATDGSMDVEYTRGEKSSFAPAFSPDGKSLAFLSSRSGKTQIWLMRLMGGEAEQITDVKKGVSRFQWSPDGKHMAFLSADPDTEEEEKQKKEKRDVIEVDKNFKYSHLYTVAMDHKKGEDRKVQRLTQGNFHVNGFDWSPDGKNIAFSHTEDPNINTGFVGGDIAVVPADSGAVQQLVTWKGSDGNPKYSPDGQFIAFESSGSEPQPIGLSDLFVIPAKGGKPKAIAQTPDRSANIVGWAKDGKSVIATEAYRTSAVAISVPVDASGKAKVVTSLDGNSSSVDFNAANNQLAFVYQTLDKPAEVFVSNAMGGATKQLSKVHSDIELPKMGKTEVMTWKSKDGMEIEGLVTYPVGYEPGKKYPLILQIHGGPAGVFSKGFTGNPSIYMTQYFAEQGFIVIRPNPRGSTGYGKDFRFANFKDWGYGDYEDVMSGVDKLIDQGAADADRMCVMGWSYGGYLTSFLVTRTDRFKAASMGAGLPNLVSMVTTTDISDYLVGHFGGEYWNDYDTYEKHSAIYQIKNVKTPTQIIHGANDLRVPFTQGQEFYQSLKRLGVQTEMLVLPRTPHGPQEPKLLMEVSPRIMNWFEGFIKIKP